LRYAKYLFLVVPALLLLSLGHSGLAMDEPYYTWVDEDGVTNFSQRNPRNVDADFISKSQVFGAKQAPARRGSRPGQIPAVEPVAAPTPQKEEAVSQEAQAVKEEIARIRASNCSIGRKNLAKLEAYSRIRVSDDKGGERVLTDEEKQQRISAAQKTIKDNCGAA